LLGVNRKFENAEGPLGNIKECAINCNGSKVGIIADNHGGVNDKFFVYDLDLDNFQSFELP
jgi:intraflagellar transport protein 140